MHELQAVLDGGEHLAGKITAIRIFARGQQQRRLDRDDRASSPRGQQQQRLDRDDSSSSSQGRYLETIADEAFAPALVFSAATGPSEVLIEGIATDQDGVLQGGLLPVLRVDAAKSAVLMLPGAPTVTLRGLHLKGRGLGNQMGTPALDVRASLLIIEGCILSSHAMSALVVSGGAEVRIVESSFESNGSPALLKGGAVHAHDLARVQIVRSQLTLNAAIDGGAIFASRARVDIYESLLSDNHANRSGGAVHAVESRVSLANATVVEANTATVSGSGVYLEKSDAWYISPAPLGRYVPGSMGCDTLQKCNYEHLGLHVATLQEALSDFPPLCSAGFVGWSAAPTDQTSPRCAGLCPPGKFCAQGTVNPQSCSIGSYCVEGSPLPVPCAPGTFGESSNLTSQEECTLCTAGAWCSGGLFIACAEGSFNPHEGSNSSFACQPCPSAYSTTRAAGATELKHCLCLPGYVHSIQNDSTVRCRPCPPGASCDRLGTSAETLFTLPGFYRPSSETLDVRKCDDWLRNCSWSACLDSTSGCRGGSSQLETCPPTLHGPFCALCNASALQNSSGSSSASGGRAFYVDATQGTDSSAIAHCEYCGWTQLWVWLLLAGVSISIVLSHAALFTLRRRSQRDLGPTSSSKRMVVNIAKWVHLALKISSGDIKLVVAFLLVATSVGDVYRVEFPQETRALLAMVRIPINLGLDDVFDGYMFECIGLRGYVPRAIAWMSLPLYVHMLTLLAAALRSRCAKEAISWRLMVERSSESMFRVLFLLYPSLIRVAFSAFDCHTFEGGLSWMKADVAVVCGSVEHQRAIYCAVVMIVVYVAGKLSVAPQPS